VGFQKSVTCAEQQLYAARSYSLIKPPSIGRRLIRSWLSSATGWVGCGGRRSRERYGSSPVVVPDVCREYPTQVPLTEDQHAVGEFGSDRTHEPFRETGRPRAARKNLDHADADIGQDRIKRRCELAGAVPDEEPELG
jgi:hypothetical protein